MKRLTMSLIAALRPFVSAVFLGMFVCSSVGWAQERITCWNSGPNAETCRIEQPNVRQSITDYPQIRFREGDIVTVSAGGCAQTGGLGATWKRYVDPRGRNADRLYSGLIYFPGLPVNDDAESREELLMPIRDVIGREIKVASHCPARADCIQTRPGTVIGHLILGYQDDDHSDNGYWEHDDGTGDQCRGVGPAWIVLVIKHAQPSLAVRTDLNGSRLKGSGPEQYLIDRGCRRWIPDIPTRDRLFRDGTYVYSPDVETICEGAPISKNAILVRAEGQREVFLLDAGVKRWITSPAVMDKYGFSWQQIRSMSPGQLQGIPAGDPIY